MTGVRDWLPYGVVTDDVVRETVEAAVARWHARWFAGTFVSATGMQPAPGAPRHENDDASWRLYRSAVAVRGGRSALIRMKDAALDINTDMLILNDADRHVLEGLERKILENLCEEIEQAFGLAGEMKAKPLRPWDPLGDSGGLLFSLSEPSGREILAVAVPLDVVLPKIKGQLGPVTRRTGALHPLTQALGSVDVAFEALVGKAELTLTELNELAVGDILLLDRALDQAVDIAGAGSHRIFAKAKLTQVDGGISLVF